MNCKCCNKQVSGSKCTFCGFVNIAVLDDSALQRELQRAAEHKKTIQYKKAILSLISDFSIEAFTYKYNKATNKLEEKDRRKIVLLDSVDSFNRKYWSNKSFMQNIEEKASKRDVRIKFFFDKKEKGLNAQFDMIKSSDFWKLGFEIYDDFSVTCYLGDESKYTKAGPYSLGIE